MSFLETIAQAKTFIREHGRVSLRALKLEFGLDDASLEGLVGELVDVLQMAALEGSVLSLVAPAPAATSAAGPNQPFVMPTGAETVPVSHGAEGERRQLTVMFCDLVGSTDLSQRLDAEDLREVVAAYQESAGTTIEALGGTVAQYLGDGLLVYFGFPEAHEDDPLRAVRAGLRILDDLPVLSARLGVRLAVLRDHPLQARIGIHTGLVVVGEMGAGARCGDLAFGETVNLAARLEAIAPPGGAVVSGATRGLLRDAFAFEDLGAQRLKGIAAPVAVARVLSSAGTGGLRAYASETPLVGREQEIGLLLDRWEEARGGRGQVVLLSGEAGMGKSRLVRTLRERVAGQPHSWLEGRGSPYHQASVFHPAIDLLQRAFLLDDDAASEDRLERVRSGLELAGLPLAETMPLFASLLSLPLPEDLPVLNLSPEAQRRRTLEAMCAWLLALGEQQPLILVAEDLHWSDPSTLELLGMLLDQAPTSPVFLIYTHRPTFVSPWASHSHVVQLPLHPLTRGQMETLVTRVAGERPLPAEVVEQIVAKTDRVPLFVEELTKTVLASDLLVERDGHFELTGPLPALAIPSTLQDSLMARLDRLGPAKEVAQLCAALGREFSHELLDAVSPLDAPLLSQTLAGLAGAELLYQRGVPPKSVYYFKHALLQEMAYQSLLKKTRQEYHARIARALEERFPERIEAEPELAARHFEEAGQIDRAIGYYRQAGNRATARSANVEAVTHLRKAIALVGTLPEGTERDGRELALQGDLGVALYAVAGVGSADVESTYGRARDLCERLGESPEMAPALAGLFAFYAGRSRLADAETMSRQILHLAEQHERRDWLQEAHLGLGIIHYFRGESRQAVTRLEASTVLCDGGLEPNWRGEVPGVVTRIYAAWALWVNGRPDRAVQLLDEAVELACAEGHPFSLAYAYAWGSVVHFMRRDHARALEHAEHGIAIAEEQGFPVQHEVARLIRLWARTSPDDPRSVNDDLVAEAEQALARLGETGTQAAAPQILGGIAEILIAAERFDQAAGYADMGIAISTSTGQPYWDADLLRIKGEALLRLGGAAEPEAESLFQRGIELAHSQEARSLELRAATSLSRLWQRKGRPTEAQALLQPVYAEFTEGADTQDLQDAQALLQRLV